MQTLQQNGGAACAGAGGQNGGAASQSGFVNGLPPMAGKGAKTLILGVFPGKKSLALKEYYSDGRNEFWRLVGQASGSPALPALSYAAKCDCLIKNGVALWDIYGAAQTAPPPQKGMIYGAYNGIAAFASEHNIQTVICNGADAGKALIDYLSAVNPLKGVSFFACVNSSSGRASRYPLMRQTQWTLALR
jgi:hypoxanthine-DNA glycosylase